MYVCMYVCIRMYTYVCMCTVYYAGVQHHDATLVNVYMYLYYCDLCNSTVGIMHVHMYNTLSHNAVFFMRVSADELYIPAAPRPHALHLGCRVHIYCGSPFVWSSCWAFSFSLHPDTSFICIILYNYTYIVKKVIDKVYVRITKYKYE